MNNKKIATILEELNKINQELPAAEYNSKSLGTMAENLKFDDTHIKPFEQKVRLLKTRYDELCLELFMMGNNESFMHN